MTTYRPVHTSGATGPAFEFASLACIWIICQVEPRGWTWEKIAA